ncbi:hypothetical protein HUT18_22540 [Streptomyces sp. NA04227]|nr:hypothetical protein HUT18_22540 [Streptomyces sp. NA04227]
MSRDEGRTERGGRAVGGGGIHISNVRGAFAIGDHNDVRNQTGGTAAPRDPAQEELLRAVKELREDLARLVPSGLRDTLDAELAGAETEIEESGQAGPTRRERLGRALAGAGAVTGFLASAATVTQALGAFSGG